MGFMDGFTSDGTVDMKHTEYYNLMKEAAKAELLSNAVKAEVRLYDRLFTVDNPEDVPEGADFTDNLNPESLTVLEAMVEPALADATIGDRMQFLRHGFFVVDQDSQAEHLVFNRIVSLKDGFAKKMAAGGAQ